MTKKIFFHLVLGVATGRVIEDLNVEFFSLIGFLTFLAIVLIASFAYDKCK